MLSFSNIKVCDSCHTDNPGDMASCIRCGVDTEALPQRSGQDLAGLEIAGKYRLEEPVGEGAMGWVYRATHRTLKTDVAVKLMKPAGDDPDRQTRFEREARLASRLSHPHIISVTDFGYTPGGLLYIVSEFIRGELLSTLLHTGDPVPLGRALTIFHQLLAAVEEAHSVGLVHRDIKPENIMITPLRSGEDFVKVLDFGIAQLADAGEGTDPFRRRGEVCGTPAYMAPEQIRGEVATPTSDLYACGLILYELLTSRPAWSSNTMMEVLAQQLHATPVPIRTASPEMSYPVELEQVVERILSKVATDRYDSATEFREALFQSVEHLRQAQIPCRSCRDGAESTWSPYCSRCGFRPAYSGSITAHVGISNAMPEPLEDGPVERVTPVNPVLTTGRKAARDSNVSTAVTMQMPELDSLDAPPLPKAPDTAKPPEARPTPRIGKLPKSTQSLRGKPFLGRDKELGEAERFLSSSDTVLEVVGDNGSGKSTLMDRIALKVDGTAILVGADPSLVRAPWYPIRRAVARVLNLESESVELSVLRRQVIGAGLVPEDVPGLVDLFGMARTAEAAVPEVRARETRAAAMRALLFSEVARNGYCLLLDDVNEFDGASLRFVQFLAESVVPGTVKLVMSTRKPVLPGDGSHASIYLGPLSLTSLEVLASAAAPRHRDPASLARSLLSRTGGNSLHVEQALLVLADGGGLLDGDLRDVVRERITKLSEPGLRLLQTLCITGDCASTHLLMKLLPDAVEFAQAIGELTGAGYITKEGELLQMCSPTLASVVRELTEHNTAQAINRELYQRLRAHGAGVIERARHAAEAQLGEEALDLLLEAGALASYWLDDEGAAVHFRRALNIARWELLMGEEDERLPLISLKLGDALRCSGHYLAAEVTYKEALASCARYPLLRARLQSGMAKLLVDRGLTDEGLQAMRQAMTLAHAGDSAALVSEMYVDLSVLLTRLGRAESAAEEFDEGIFLVTSGDGAHTSVPPRGFWKLLAQAAEVRNALDDIPQSLEMASLALQHAQREQSLLGQAQSHLLLARLYDDPDQVGQFDDHYASAVAAFKRLGDRRSVAECFLLQASRYPGRRPELVQRALDLAQQIDWADGVNEALRLR